MQDLLNSEFNDELDLRELFITLWAYKLFIALTCALGVIYGGYFALNAEKEYTSAAIFKLNKNSKSSKFFRFINEVPTLLLILIVFIVVFKPL